jgi:prepilin-type N-terminal cleavage/methylation domain-containing protein
MNLSLKRGFTILELLVVIAIIAILAGLVLVDISAVRARARDTRRIMDARSLSTAIQMYENSKGELPDIAEEDQGIPGIPSDGWNYGNVAYPSKTFIKPLMDEGILSKPIIETDPSLSDSYRYAKITDADGCTGTFGVLLIRLERNQSNYPMKDQVESCYTGDIREDNTDNYILLMYR